MKIDRSWTYPAPATDVYAMICDEAFQQRRPVGIRALAPEGGGDAVAQLQGLDRDAKAMCKPVADRLDLAHHRHAGHRRAARRLSRAA